MNQSDHVPSESPEGFSLVDGVFAILKHRRMVLFFGIACAVLTAVYVLARPRTFTSHAAFTPQVTGSQLGALGALGGLAAQFGVAVPTADGNKSPAFYADLLHSRTVLEPLVQLPVRFQWRGEVQAGTFADLALTPDLDSALRLPAAVLSLRRAMVVSVEARTGVVNIATTTRYPQLSAILTDSALALLNSFNVESRRTQAAAQRQFLEERLATTLSELREAEEAVSDFAKRNRGTLASSPELTIQQERLNRTLSLRAQVHGGLAQALEQAKLDEIRDTPLITLIESAEVAAEPNPRGLITKTMVAFIVGLAMGAVAALVRRAVSASLRERPESFHGVSVEYAALRADVARLLRLGRGR